MTIKAMSGRALRPGNAGSAAIEFGLFIPLLAILVTGVVEAGFAMYQAMVVCNAAEAGMLYAAKHGWDQAGISSAVTNATSLAGMTASPAPSQFCGCPGTTGITVASCGSTCSSGFQASQYIQINATVPRFTIIANSGLPLPSTLSAQSILRLN